MKRSFVFRLAALSLLAFGLFVSPYQIRSAQAQTLNWTALNEPSVGGAMTDLSISPFDNNRVLVGGDMLGVGLSANGGDSWLPTFGFKSWEICSFTWHPTNSNTVWVGTMSGPYLSTDGGVNWTEKRSGMPAPGGYYYSCPIERILFDPGNASHLWAFSGSQRRWGGGGDNNLPDWNSVWESVNGGTSWTRIATVGVKTANGIIAAVVSGGSGNFNLYCLVVGQGVFKSSDGGKNWASVNTGLPTLSVNDLVVHPAVKDTLYVGYDRYSNGSAYLPGGIAKSTNGSTWTTVNTGLNQLSNTDYNQASGYSCLAISRNNPNTLYTSDVSYAGQGIFRSANGGANWTAVLGNGASVPSSPDAAGPGMNTIAVSADATRVYGGTSATLYRSTNSGTTWTDTSSIASGSKWSGRGFAGWVTSTVKVNPYSNQIVLMSWDDGKFQSSIDNGATWQHRGAGLSAFNGGQDVTFAGTNGQTLYGTFGQANGPDGSGIAKSSDGGVNWTYVNKPSGATGQGYGIYALPSTPSTVWVCYGGALYRSTDSGTNWSKITGNGIENDGQLYAISPDPTNASVFYVPGNSGVWKTTNGTTFTLMTGSPARSGNLVVDPTLPSRLYVTRRKTGSNDGLYRYDGASWTYLRAEGSISAVAVNPTNANQIIYTSSDDPYSDYNYGTGVWLSNDGGNAWTQQNTGLPMIRVSCITFNKWVPNQALIGTNGRGFFKASVGAIVRVDAGGAAVSPFSADANFSGGTTSSTTQTITVAGQPNPAPMAVYQTERYGNTTYTIPGGAPGAPYTVRLHFAEIYWNAAGKRKFNVSVNGTSVLSNFDIYAAAGGQNKGIVREFTTNASGTGQVVIQLSTVLDNATVNGIEVYPASHYYENFDGNAANGWLALSGTWGATGQVYRQTAVSSRCLSFYNSKSWSSYTYNVDCYPNYSNGFGAVYNYQDANNYYELFLTTSGTATIYKTIAGVRTQVATSSYSGGGQYVWSHLKIAYNGTATTIMINGSTVCNNITQLEIGSGKVGLLADYNPVDFDNVSVTVP